MSQRRNILGKVGRPRATTTSAPKVQIIEFDTRNDVIVRWNVSITSEFTVYSPSAAIILMLLLLNVKARGVLLLFLLLLLRLVMLHSVQRSFSNTPIAIVRLQQLLLLSLQHLLRLFFGVYNPIVVQVQLKIK